ncbi:hypothetical protein ACFLZB_00505 [Nanoarchaeota archaeon]
MKETNLETCIKKTKAEKAREVLNSSTIPSVVKYYGIGCYSCDGKDKTCQKYDGSKKEFF